MNKATLITILTIAGIILANLTFAWGLVKFHVSYINKQISLIWNKLDKQMVGKEICEQKHISLDGKINDLTDTIHELKSLMEENHKYLHIIAGEVAKVIIKMEKD